MLNRRTWIVALVALLLMASLGGCAAGDVPAPDREVPISVDAALEGQNAGLAGLMGGNVTWTEAQFSSFLTELLRQNTGPNQPVDAITAWFDPDNNVHLRVALKDGVLLGGKNIDLTGKVAVVDGKVQLNLAEAGANGMMLSGAWMQYISDYINSYLASPSFGVAADVQTGDGTITISLGGM
jgi:hypothetical protein